MYGVIMAGGRGTRFWPSSRKENPKQLLNIIGNETMLQMTVDRLQKMKEESEKPEHEVSFFRLCTASLHWSLNCPIPVPDIQTFSDPPGGFSWMVVGEF